jgi:hypothetical protein
LASLGQARAHEVDLESWRFNVVGGPLKSTGNASRFAGLLQVVRVFDIAKNRKKSKIFASG